MEEIRLNKYLSEMGICSRREADRLIEAGKVLVDGQTASMGMKITPDQKVVCDGKTVGMVENGRRKKPKPVLLMVNKPRGIVSTTSDKDRAMNIVELVKYPERVYPVGRLDKDTTGLLLLTNDGALAHDLLSPKKHVDKTYLVQPDHPLSEEDIHRLEEGLDIGDDKPTAPAKAVITPDGDLLLTIHEGRFHQVKRMLQAVGNQVCALERVSFGPLTLDPSLPRGAHRALTEEEICALANTQHQKK